jgi:hypothetical protein
MALIPKIRQAVQQESIKAIIQIVVGLSLTGLIVSLLYPLFDTFWQQLFSFLWPVLSVELVRKLVGLLLVLQIISLAFIFYLLRQKRSGFEFISRLGVYRHKKTGVYYCTSCLKKDNLISPLREYQAGWQCQVKSCEKFYTNPDYKKPPRQRTVLRWPQI